MSTVNQIREARQRRRRLTVFPGFRGYALTLGLGLRLGYNSKPKIGALCLCLPPNWQTLKHTVLTETSATTIPNQKIEAWRNQVWALTFSFFYASLDPILFWIRNHFVCFYQYFVFLNWNPKWMLVSFWKRKSFFGVLFDGHFGMWIELRWKKNVCVVLVLD